MLITTGRYLSTPRLDGNIRTICDDTRLRESVTWLDFVRFCSAPGPEEAVVCDVAEGLIEGQDASAHVVDVFPFSAV